MSWFSDNIGGLLSGVGTLISAPFSAISANRQEINNRAAMREQNEWNLAQWNRENEYNSPKSQMQRFADAGLNPNLIYGQGTNGNSGHITSAPVQARKSVDIGSMITQILPAFMALKLQEQQLEKGATEIDGMKTDNAIKEQFGMLQAGANYRNTLVAYQRAKEEFSFMKQKAPLELQKLYLQGQLSRQEYQERKEKLPFVLAGLKANLASQIYDIRRQQAFDPYWNSIAKAKDIQSNLQNAESSQRIKMNNLDYSIKDSSFAEWKGNKGNRLSQERSKTRSMQEAVKKGIYGNLDYYMYNNNPLWATLFEIGNGFSHLNPIKFIK